MASRKPRRVIQGLPPDALEAVANGTIDALVAGSSDSVTVWRLAKRVNGALAGQRRHDCYIALAMCLANGLRDIEPASREAFGFAVLAMALGFAQQADWAVSGGEWVEMLEDRKREAAEHGGGEEE